MASGPAFVLLQLLVLAAIGQPTSVEASSRVRAFTKLPETAGRASIRTRLIHRDQFLVGHDGEWLREKRDRDARRRSQIRVESFLKRRLLGGAQGQGQENTAQGNSSAAVADWVTPLSDIAEDEYLMEISLGTPPQTFLAIADTGSDLTWVECDPCKSCSLKGKCKPCSSGPVFQPSKSSSYSPLSCTSTACTFLRNMGAAKPSCDDSEGCGYTYGYGDQSATTGTVAQDIITMREVQGGTQAVPDFWFGCSNAAASDSGLVSVAQGLVGLGRGAISFPSQLGTYFDNKFGYCLVSRSISNTFAYSSPLYFGSEAVPSAPGNVSSVQYTPMLSNPAFPSFYYVGCDGISLNGALTITPEYFKLQSDGSRGIIFDSGTTYTTLFSLIYDPLTAAIQNQITKYPQVSDAGGLCYQARWRDWVADYGQAVPSMSFLFSNTSGFDLTVDTAWRELDRSTVCLAMQGTQYEMSIFGNYQQVGYQILYDVGNTEIGFVKAHCNGTNTGLHLRNDVDDDDNGSTFLAPQLLSALPLLLLLLALLAQASSTW